MRLNQTVVNINTAPVQSVRQDSIVGIFCAPQVANAMRRMHERQNIGKVILLPEAKKEEEKPKSDAEPVENAEKTAAADNQKKEEATEEVKDWVRVLLDSCALPVLCCSKEKRGMIPLIFHPFQSSQHLKSIIYKCFKVKIVTVFVYMRNKAVWQEQQLFGTTMWRGVASKVSMAAAPTTD